MNTPATPVGSPVDSPADGAPPEGAAAPVWYVNAKGTPMTRHTAHKSRPNKTACNLSLPRMRAADEAENTRLGVCAFCEPAGKAAAKKRRR